jgi:hypothetical protein
MIKKQKKRESFFSKLFKINLKELNSYNTYSFLLYDEDIIDYFYRQSKNIDRLLFFIIGGILGYATYVGSYAYYLLVFFLLPYFLPWYKSTIVKFTIENEWKGLVDKLNRDFYGVALTLYQISSPTITSAELFKQAYKLPELNKELKVFLKFIVFNLEKGYPENEVLYKAITYFPGKKMEKFLSDLILSVEEGNLHQYLKEEVYEESKQAELKVKGYTSILKAITTMVIALTVMLNVVLLIITSYTYGQIAKFSQMYGSVATGATGVGGIDVEEIIPKIPVKQIFLFEAFFLFPAIAFLIFFINKTARPLGT